MKDGNIFSMEILTPSKGFRSLQLKTKFNYPILEQWTHDSQSYNSEYEIPKGKQNILNVTIFNSMK